MPIFINYLELSSRLQSLICLLFLLLFVYAAYETHLAYWLKLGKSVFIRIVLMDTITGLTYFHLVILYVVAHRKIEVENYPADGLNGLPLWGLLAFAAWLILHEILVYFKIARWRQLHLNQLSLKNAMDNLPDGSCFYSKEGFPLLVNRVMQGLAQDLTGHSIQDAGAFWEQVQNGPYAGNTQRVADTNEVLIRDSRGQIWRFQQAELAVEDVYKEPIYRLSASGISEIWQAGAELQEENRKLLLMSERLRDYRRNLDHQVKEDELLAMRLRVHDELGQVLLETHRYLSVPEGEGGKRKELLSDWKRVTTLLNREEGMRIDNQPQKELSLAAKSMGLSLELLGEMPEKERLLHLLMSGARESMTNAAHAGANRVTIDVSREENWVMFTYRNNGEEPVYPIHEGGGLSSLRRLVEKEGGRMELAEEGDFYMTLRIPDRRERR